MGGLPEVSAKDSLKQPARPGRMRSLPQNTHLPLVVWFQLYAFRVWNV